MGSNARTTNGLTYSQVTFGENGKISHDESPLRQEIKVLRNHVNSLKLENFQVSLKLKSAESKVDLYFTVICLFVLLFTYYYYVVLYHVL